MNGIQNFSSLDFLVPTVPQKTTIYGFWAFLGPSLDALAPLPDSRDFAMSELTYEIEPFQTKS